MRPFATLGVKPFLWATPAELSQLQKKYLALSRDHHPDRVDQSDAAALERAESTTALLNLDYSRLRDFWKLVEAVLAEGLDPTVCPVRNAKAAPPELAMEYFELQERAADEGPRSPGVAAALTELERKIGALLAQQESLVQDFAQRFPFAGFDETLTQNRPWTQDDLLELRGLLEQVRYSRSFLRDLKAKFGAA